MTKQIHLAAHFPGVNNTTVWSDPSSGSQTDFASFVHLARTAERGKFDFFFLAEGLRLREHRGQIFDLDVVGRPDSFTVLAALAAVTEHIGLAGTSTPRSTSPTSWPANSPASTTSPAAGRRGTWSPPRMPSRGRTSVAAGTWPKATATSGPGRSWPRRTSCGTAGTATKSWPTRHRPVRGHRGAGTFRHRDAVFDIPGQFNVPAARRAAR